jgi:undecaprenyl-diphosphatase
MPDLDILVLGLIQGITEFLPVSSSGHLVIFQIFRGSPGDSLLTYDLILHCATMLATLTFFSREILRTLFGWLAGFFSRAARYGDEWRYGWAVIWGTFATAPMALAAREWMDAVMGSLVLVGSGLLATSFMVWLADRILPRKEPITYKRGLWIGFMQGVAALPGVSRSGATLFAGMLCGLSTDAAFRFSFILSLPAITGATLLEGVELLRHGEIYSALPDGWLWGALIAYVFGLISLYLLHQFVIRGRWKVFYRYCFVLALCLLGYSLLKRFGYAGPF